MSNKSRLQTNNENLQSLIDKANQLPEASGGGSSEYKTCTLKICFDEAFQSYCGDLYVDVGYCTLDESGNPKLVYVDGNDGEPLTSTSSFLTIENVLCGEGIVLNDAWTSDISWFDISCDNGNSTELLYDWLWVGTVGYIVVYPSAANSTITVTYTSDSWG